MNKGTEMQTESPIIRTSLLEMHQISSLCQVAVQVICNLGPILGILQEYHSPAAKKQLCNSKMILNIFIKTCFVQTSLPLQESMVLTRHYGYQSANQSLETSCLLMG